LDQRQLLIVGKQWELLLKRLQDVRFHNSMLQAKSVSLASPGEPKFKSPLLAAILPLDRSIIPSEHIRQGVHDLAYRATGLGGLQKRRHEVRLRGGDGFDLAEHAPHRRRIARRL